MMQGTPLLKSVKEFKSLNQINIKRAKSFVFTLCKRRELSLPCYSIHCSRKTGHSFESKQL